MSKRLDSILVVDVESTCWDGDPPAGQRSEIIEIGVATLNLRTLAIDYNEGVYVHPEHSQVSAFCEELTGITSEILASEGKPFLQAGYLSKHCTWASWGDYDRRQFERCCEADHVPYPFGITHLNVKNLFAVVNGLDREIGMDQALKLWGMELEGRHHQGVDDARNIARLLAEILRRARPASFPEGAKRA